MGILRIRLFGRVQISHDDWLTEVRTTRIVQGLLAYLFLQRHRSHSRDALANLFWSEQNQEKAYACLNTTLWRLRQVLEPRGILPGVYLVSNQMGEVGLNQASTFWLDVAALEEQIAHTLKIPYQSVESREINQLTTILQLYRGDLLEGFYDDWALRERERLRALYLDSLAYLMYYEKYHGSFENGLVYGQQILQLDPLREEIQREMIRLYVANGQRAMAVRQYKACCEVLNDELGIEPMKETKDLYARITSDIEPASVVSSKNEAIRLQKILHGLVQAAQTVEQLQDQLYKAIGSIKAQEDT